MIAVHAPTSESLVWRCDVPGCPSEATPEILRGLMCELSSEDAQWKPAPERFSVAEVLAHLSHREGHCYRLRVDRFMTEDMPALVPTSKNTLEPSPSP